MKLPMGAECDSLERSLCTSLTYELMIWPFRSKQRAKSTGGSVPLSLSPELPEQTADNLPIRDAALAAGRLLAVAIVPFDYL
jgi:hypothetical protein